MDFTSALLEEEKWLANVVDAPIPTDTRAGHRTYIGPTAIDMSALDERQKEQAIREHEQRVLSAYRHHDHRGYRGTGFIRSF